MKGIEILIMDAKTVDEVVSTVVCPTPGTLNHTITLKSSNTLTGAVQIETANDPTYTGVWSPLGGGPINAADIGTGASELILNFSNIAITALRVRISTVIAGGTLSASYLGNG